MTHYWSLKAKQVKTSYRCFQFPMLLLEISTDICNALCNISEVMQWMTERLEILQYLCVVYFFQELKMKKSENIETVSLLKSCQRDYLI